jgi:Ca-activated chloride channel family protein
MAEIVFLHPQFFWLFLLLPLAAAWHWWKRKQQPGLKLPTLNGFKAKPSLLARLKPMLFVMRLLALSSLIIALARPRTQDVNVRTITTEGIDIVMAIDVSTSMLADDIAPNRLEALKKVAEKFVDNRENDRLGIVIYSGDSYTKAPVTSDHELVKLALRSVKSDYTVLKDGTGIGIGLATAINRLKNSKAKSRIIILLTDGVNNAGTVAPEVAAEIADKFDIKVYTIGIGTIGYAMQPTGEVINGEIVFENSPVKIDEELMRNIAKKTGGQYFRATDNTSLQAVYNEIDKLEKSEIKDKRYLNYIEKFPPFLWISFVLAVVEIILRRTVYRSII